jgi:hypothetical protein
MKMKPRKIRIDGIEVIITSCWGCLLNHNDDERGDSWCKHPLSEDRDIQSDGSGVYEWFPEWCCLKETIP